MGNVEYSVNEYSILAPSGVCDFNFFSTGAPDSKMQDEFDHVLNSFKLAN